MAQQLHERDIEFNKMIQFSSVCDKMKNIYRQTLLADGSRRETDAEHSWHLALMAMLFGEFAPEGTDINKVIRMVIVHDLVEIYAGDTFCYDEKAGADKKEREKKSSEKLFSILPKEKGEELRNLWLEFDEEKTNEAIFAASLDRLQPLINNFFTDGHTWRKGNVAKEKVEKREEILEKGMPIACDLVKEILQDAEYKGFFSKK